MTDPTDPTVTAVSDALAILAAYPLEEFGKDRKPDSHPLFGANNWQLTVGHVRAARSALADVGEQLSARLLRIGEMDDGPDDLSYSFSLGVWHWQLPEDEAGSAYETLPAAVAALEARLPNGTGKQPLPSTVALADVGETPEARIAARQDAIMRNDYPKLREFFQKYALGSLARPSCLVCGIPPEEWPPAIQHAELPDVVVCFPCRDAGKQPRPAAEVRALTPTRLDTGSIFMLKNLAAANAREGITSSLMPADVYSLCAEVLALRRALESIRCRSSELAKKTSVEIRNDLHGIHADAAEALVESPAAPTAQGSAKP